MLYVDHSKQTKDRHRQTCFHDMTDNSVIARSAFQEPIGWELYLPLFVVVPHRWHLHLSPLYEVLDHTNQIFSVRIWSWQRVIIIISSYDDHHIIIWWSSYHHTTQNTRHMLYFWKEEDSRISNMTHVHHQCIIGESSMHRQCIIRLSKVHLLRIISASSVDQQQITSASSAHHKCITSASSAHQFWAICDLWFVTIKFS